MLYFTVLLGFFCLVNVNHAQVAPCKQLDNCVCSSILPMPYGETRLKAIRSGLTCNLQYCFGRNTVTFPVTDPVEQTLFAQNCRAGFLDNNVSTCSNAAYVSGYGCKLCECTAPDHIAWKEITRYGRTCRGFICKNVTSMGFNCGSIGGLRYVPKLGLITQTSFGIIRAPINDGASGFIATNGYTSEYSEFSKYMSPTWSCPPAAAQMCDNNVDNTLTAASPGRMYMNGSLYFKRNAAGSTCSVYTCSQGGWGTPVVFTNATNIKTDPAQTAFVQDNCASESRLQPCLSGTSPLYYQFNSNDCSRATFNFTSGTYVSDSFNGNTRSQFCRQFFCPCPAGRGADGSVWYMPRRQARTRPASPTVASFGVTTLADQWTGYSYSCVQYTCRQRLNMPANATTVTGSTNSRYSNVDPCDVNLGFTNAVGKYWNGMNYADYSLYERSSIIANSIPTRGTNATCMALGMGKCYEVKYYAIDTFSRTGGCPGAQSHTDNCPVARPDCQRTSIYRAPNNGYISVPTRQGTYVGTRLQCYPDGENFAQQPYCMKNTQMQNAYEKYDRCINNGNYVWNIVPKAVPTGACSGGARDYQLEKGACDHSIFRNYIQHLGNCHCGFVRDLNQGADFPGKETSIQNQFYTLLDADLMTFVNTLADYGCTYAPIKCLANGQVSFSVDRLSISGTFTVGNPCEFTNFPSIRVDLEEYFKNAGIVSGTTSLSNKMRVFNMRDVGGTCVMDFKAFVFNRVWADYLKNNMTMTGNGGALHGSVTGLVINSELLPTGAAGPTQIYLGLFVAVGVFSLLW